MLLVVLVLGVGRWVVAQGTETAGGAANPRLEPTVGEMAGQVSESAAATMLLYGRVTLDDGTTHEGRLRFGGDEEALWSNYFNGTKAQNPWVDLVPEDLRPSDRRSVSLFGFEWFGRDVRRELSRPFMARFGDIARIEARGRALTVTLKSGTLFHLDRFGADDFADGLTLWASTGDVLELGEWGVRSIDFMPGDPAAAPPPAPLHGTVRTAQGDFTGLLQWDREATLVTDALEGHTGDARVRVAFDAVESIERTPKGARVVMRDGETLDLSGSRAVGEGNRGVYVDDPRYGRVLVSWDTFQRVDFSPAGGMSRGYESYPPGSALRGIVFTRAGRTLTGRLVFDLDESETTETLDAPIGGVDYTIPFELIGSIDSRTPGAVSDAAAAEQPVEVTLRSGEVIRLETDGDLGAENAGLLVFTDGSDVPEYVAWRDVRRVEFHDSPKGSALR